MKLLSRDFFLRNPLIVAPELLGKILTRKFNGIIISGRIVEVEAYLPSGDEAAHGFKGLTKRNLSLFKEGGHAYIHQIHKQNCFDIVAEKANIPAGILIRALEPLQGIDLMKKFRDKE
ncbi:MAG: DNA-3-methyladenine glycosylase [Patescibacteria group bacterium]|nr:DNA-3-methyladenine glycosylase [Patescibacteria group bacterium]